MQIVQLNCKCNHSALHLPGPRDHRLHELFLEVRLWICRHTSPRGAGPGEVHFPPKSEDGCLSGGGASLRLLLPKVRGQIRRS